MIRIADSRDGIEIVLREDTRGEVIAIDGLDECGCPAHEPSRYIEFYREVLYIGRRGVERYRYPFYE